MPDQFDIDFNQQAEDIFPPDKRTVGNMALLKGIIKSLQWCRDLILGSYKKGSTAPQWAPGGYNKYDQVIFNKSVYESLIDSNTDSPNGSANWRLIQNNFIGVDERVRFNGQKIVLEYALNKRFGGTFRPPSSLSLSDIYITNLPAVVFGFRVGQTTGSSVGQTTSPDTIGSPLPFVRINNFQINFLNSLYVLTNEKEVRDFANLYVAAGLNYTIVTY